MDHIPVLTKEVLEYLDPKPDENFIDGTVGNGGHANLLLEKTSPFGKLLGIDADVQQITNTRHSTQKYSERIILINDSYAKLQEIAQTVRLKPIHGILLDLGYSSWHMAESGKGFSFLKNEPLDMRYGSSQLTAAIIVNEYKEGQIEKIIKEYGEEKFARQISKAIVRHRRGEKIESTFELKKIIEETVGQKYKGERIHCATRTFQALRIAVNGELENLEEVLPQAIEMLAPGGRLAVISFHSLEDRIVKHFFQQKEKEGIITILTKKPIMAGEDELLINSRSRSAKLRAIQKL